MEEKRAEEGGRGLRKKERAEAEEVIEGQWSVSNLTYLAGTI